MRTQHADDAEYSDEPDYSGRVEQADEAALIGAAQRDVSAFGPLYERYVDQIYRYAYRRVGNHADAEDVTAQTFQQALAALPSYEWRGVPFGAWLYRIAGNLIIRRGRTGSREVTVEDVTLLLDHDMNAENDPARLIEQDAAHNRLVEAVRQLPLDQQRVIVLKFSRGLRNREIGEVIGRSEGAAKQLVHRAMLTLRASLGSSESLEDAGSV